MRILIAEDERITRMTLVRQLENWGHEVVACEDGQLAWDQVSVGEFDVVITDWDMPRVTGLELVGRIREIPRVSYTYIIILTSRTDKSDVVSGIEAGADDFLSKPFDREELRVRLLAGERIINLERMLKKQNEELRDANERIHHGLLAAARVQKSMLPRANIITPRARTAWKYAPTDELAGDAIGLHLIDDRYLIAYVLDVSGHGVPAALLSVSAMHSLDPSSNAASFLRDMNRSGGIGTVRRPAEVAAELNRRFRPGENDGRFMTMILCVLDTQTGQLHYTCAGHFAPLVLRNGIPVEVPEAGGFPISTIDDAEFEDGSFQLQPGDRVCLYSDGVIEQLHASQTDQFGLVRLLEVLTDGGGRAPLESITAALPRVLAQWAGSASFADDVSLVLVEWAGPA